METFHYAIYGLLLKSDIMLPGLVATNRLSYDVRIVFGEVPPHLPFINHKGINYEAFTDDFLFKLKDVAWFRIQKGKTIIIKPLNNSDSHLLRIVLLGTVMGIILLQKGFLPIHGSAIHTKKGAFIFAGPSSSGKSTLLTKLIDMGYPAITDDISAIKINKRITLYHGMPQVKIWDDVAQYFNMENISKLRPEINKYTSPILENFRTEVSTIDTIIILGRHNDNAFSARKLTGSEKVNALLQNTYRYQFISGLNMQHSHFMNVATIAKSVKIFKVLRPSKPLLIEELSSFIESKFIN